VPDITVSYEEMQASATKLDQGKASIEEQLESLRRMIDQLVQTSFKTQSASPKFRESYEQWNTGAKNAVAGLEGMSGFLKNAIKGHQDLDSSLTQGMPS
jgi:WXG100 family type VII secretion target